VTVIELLERYIALKQGIRHATKVGYNFVLNLAKKQIEIEITPLFFK